MVGEVALGVDQNGRNPLQGGFFEQDNAHTRLSGAGHAGYHGVSGEITWVVISELVGDDRPGSKVVSLTEVKF